MTLKIERLLELKSFIDEAAHRFGASDVRIFGSVARGTAKEGSDVDVLVRMDKGRSLLDLVGLQQALEDELGVRVDVVTEGGLHPLLRPAILAEAQTL